MSRRFALVGLVLGLALSTARPAGAQDWPTLGNDAQRSGWLRTDAKISPSTVKPADFQLLWKMPLDAGGGPGNALTPTAHLDFLISHRGFRTLAFVAGRDGNVAAIDKDLGRMEWERRFDLDGPAAGTAACPGGMTASVSRPTVAALPALAGLTGFGGGGRRSPGVSGVGEPNAGAITLAARPSPGFRRPEPPEPGGRTQPPPRRSLFGLTVLYALTSDGLLRTMLVSDGYDHGSPVPFLPANANALGLLVVDEVAYVTTAHGCGGVPDGVWALDLESKKVMSWKAGSGSIAGNAGPVMGPDGTVYTATTDGRVVALQPGTLVEKAVYKAAGASFVSSPVFIDFNEADYLAVAAKDGSIHLLDAARLDGAALSKTPGYAGADRFAPNALATWRDFDGQSWLLAPVGGAQAANAGLAGNGSVSKGAIAAWKIVDKGGKPAFEGGWVSRDIASPLPPIIINGVIFAASSGGPSGGKAKIYALDGVSGKVLWDSGDTISAAAPAGGLSAGGSSVYLGADDGTLYAFGFPIEH